MSKLAQRIERLLIAGRNIFCPPLIVQPGVLGSNRRIIQSRRNRMGWSDLSRYVLQNKGVSPLQHPGPASLSAEPRGMFSQRVSPTSSFHANELHVAIADELIERTDSVGTPANTSDYGGRQFPFRLQDLLARLFADNPVEVAHHGGIRMCAQHASQQVMC